MHIHIYIYIYIHGITRYLLSISDTHIELTCPCDICDYMNACMFLDSVCLVLCLCAQRFYELILYTIRLLGTHDIIFYSQQCRFGMWWMHIWISDLPLKLKITQSVFLGSFFILLLSVFSSVSLALLKQRWRRCPRVGIEIFTATMHAPSRGRSSATVASRGGGSVCRVSWVSQFGGGNYFSSHNILGGGLKHSSCSSPTSGNDAIWINLTTVIFSNWVGSTTD